jgi:hypothetical protein
LQLALSNGRVEPSPGGLLDGVAGVVVVLVNLF